MTHESPCPKAYNSELYGKEYDALKKQVEGLKLSIKGAMAIMRPCRDTAEPYQVLKQALELNFSDTEDGKDKLEEL